MGAFCEDDDALGSDGVAEGGEDFGGGGEEVGALVLERVDERGDLIRGIGEMEGSGDGKTRGEAVGNEAFAFDEEQGLVFAIANEAGGFDVVVAVAGDEHERRADEVPQRRERIRLWFSFCGTCCRRFRVRWRGRDRRRGWVRGGGR